MRAVVSAAIVALMLGCSTTDVPSYYISGTVYDATWSTFVQGAEVTITIDDDGPPKRYVGWSHIDSGRFQIPDVPYGHYAVIHCSARGYRDYEEQRFISDPDEEINIYLAKL